MVNKIALLLCLSCEPLGRDTGIGSSSGHVHTVHKRAVAKIGLVMLAF